MVGLTISAMVARHLGPEAFGRFSLVWAAIGLFTPLATLSMDRITVRDFAEKPGQGGYVLINTVLMRAMGGAFGLLMAALLTGVLYGADMAWLATLGGLTLVLQCADAIDHYYQARLESRTVTGAKVLSLVSALVLRWALIVNDAAMIWFVVAVVVDAVVLYGTLWVVFRWRRVEKMDRGRIDPEFWQTRLRECWPLMISGGAYFAYMRLPQLMLGRLGDAREVAYYSIAMRIAEGGLPLLHVIGASFYPSLISFYRSDREEYWALYEKWTSILWVVMLVCLTGALFLIRPAVLLLFGESYIDAVKPITLVMVGFFIMGVAVFRAGHLTIAGHQRHLMISALAGVMVAALGWFVIGQYASQGAAIVFIAVQAVTMLGMDWLFAQTRPLARLHGRVFLGKTIFDVLWHFLKKSQQHD